MSSSSFTTPADRRRRARPRTPPPAPTRRQQLLTWGLLAIWLLLMAFGAVAWVNPPWLQELSRPGRQVEAAEGQRLGDEFLKQRNYALAIANYRKSLEILPEQPGVLVNMAIAYRDAGDLAGSARLLTDMLQRENSPGLLNAIYYNLGEVRERQGNRAEALRCYEQAARYRTGEDRAYRKLAALYAEAGRYEEARQASRRALETLLDPALEYESMLHRSRDMYRDEPEQLAAIEAQLSRPVTADELARYDLELLQQVQQKSPEVARMYEHLGLLCVRLGDLPGAIDCFQRVLQIQPDHSETQERLRQLRQIQASSSQPAPQP